MEAPEERFAALLGGREEVLPAEELVLRARADLNAGRVAEAALQARVAIEALLAAQVASEDSGAAGGSLAAPRGDRGGGERRAQRRAARRQRGRLEEAVAAMELALSGAGSALSGVGRFMSERYIVDPPGARAREHRRQLGHHVAVQLHLGVGVVRRRALGDRARAGRPRRASSPGSPATG